MHGVLALSALHIACTNPAKAEKYTQLCDKHQTIALASYRDILSHITEDVANAVFALSTILSFSSMARATLEASRMAEPQFISLKDVCELLHLNKGTREVNLAAGDAIARGPFSAMLYGHRMASNVRATLTDALQDVFADLESMVNEFCTNSEHLELCMGALVSLHDVYANILFFYSKGKLENGQVWRWTALIPQEFVKLIQTEYPPALVITAHFTIASLLTRQSWYVSAWGKLAFEGICMALKGRLGEYMIWPREEIASDNASFKHGPAISRTSENKDTDDSLFIGGTPRSNLSPHFL